MKKLQGAAAAAIIVLAPLPAVAVTGYFEDLTRMNGTAYSSPIDFLTSSGRTPYGSFGIDVIFETPSNVTPSIQAAFDTAEGFWEQRILGYEFPALADFIAINFPTVQIQTFIQTIDGEGGILGGAGSTGQVFNGDGAGKMVAPGVNNVMVSISGLMRFDIADIPALQAAGTFVDVVVHEMAHALGFSDFFWNYVAAVAGENQDTSYTGPIALSTYRHEFDPSATFVPVEDEGGPGTAFAHWDEQLFANFDPGAPEASTTGNPELMTGYLSGPTYLSRTTLASFDDLGYVTTATMPVVPVPLSGLLLATGLGALGWAGRRRRGARSGGRVAV